MSLCEPIRREIEALEDCLITEGDFNRKDLDMVRDFTLNRYASLPDKFYESSYDEDEDEECEELNGNITDLMLLWKKLRTCELDALKELKS